MTFLQIFTLVASGATIFALIRGIFSVYNGRMTRREISRQIAETAQSTKEVIEKTTQSTRELIAEESRLIRDLLAHSSGKGEKKGVQGGTSSNVNY